VRRAALAILGAFLATPVAAATFEDLWLTRIKPPPYGGVATEFSDRKGAWGNRIDPSRDRICAHMIEARGQRLRVTNVETGRSTVCVVQDRGPHRRFWPRREVDLTPPVSREIGCNGKCRVEIEREPAGAR
jgi:rare lipoprotein A (peptidoglycan hydrolase)